jgi:hypothetical protein
MSARPDTLILQTLSRLAEKEGSLHQDAARHRITDHPIRSRKQSPHAQDAPGRLLLGPRHVCREHEYQEQEKGDIPQLTLLFMKKMTRNRPFRGGANGCDRPCLDDASLSMILTQYATRSDWCGRR